MRQACVDIELGERYKFGVMLTPDERRERALKVAEEIVNVKGRLAVLVEEFNALMGGGAAPAATNGKPDAIESAQGSAASRILAVFTRQPGKKIATQDVVAELADVDPSLVRSTINRMGRTGKLKPVKRGVYKFAPPSSGESGEGQP